MAVLTDGLSVKDTYQELKRYSCDKGKVCNFPKFTHPFSFVSQKKTIPLLEF